MRRFVRVLPVVVLAAACAHKPKLVRCESPPPFFVTLAAAPNLNPDPSGGALPTAVRLFQLTSLAKAEGLEARDFFDKIGELLGEDMISMEDLTLEPGERVERWLNRKGASNYLVAVALFRQPKGNSWRTVISIPLMDEADCPADVLPPRVGKPGKRDLKMLISLQGFEIEGTKLGVAQ